MTSVYDAALTHAEKLKAELETLQHFLDLHEHFRERFGLASSAETAPAAETAAAPKTESAADEEAGATHEIHVQEPTAEGEDTVEAQTGEAQTVEAQSGEPQTGEAKAKAPELATETSPEAEGSSSDEDEPRVIRASEGVLIAAPSEASSTEPLGQEATLQSVAEKLAATISASHPSVTGYTV